MKKIAFVSAVLVLSVFFGHFAAAQEAAAPSEPAQAASAVEAAPEAANQPAAAPAATEPAPASEANAPAEDPMLAQVAPAKTPGAEVPVVEVPAPLTKATLLVKLPEICPTPDAFVLAPWGDLLLSCPNFADTSNPPVILSISPDNKVRLWAMCPVDPKTGAAGPMGMAFGPDGNLYIADNVGWKDGKVGRILRLIVNDQHRPVGAEVVAYGLGHPNGVRIQNGFIYVTNSITEVSEDGKLFSSVFRFPLDAKNVKVTNSISDPNVLLNVQTENPKNQYGLDGICFDKDGNLYLGNFGDGVVLKVTFDAEGKPSEPVVFAKDPQLKTVDGLIAGTDGNLYLCDFAVNSVKMVKPDGTVVNVAQNGDTNGANGELDQPGDLIQRGNELIISNFDAVTGGGNVNTAHDEPHTISVIKLDF